MDPKITSSFELGHNMGTWFLSMVEESTKQAYHFVWTFIKQLMIEHWVFVIIFLITIFIISLIKYLTTGRWKML